MDVSEITKHYELKAITVRPDQLLLDPNNPRIVLDVNTDRKFIFSDLISYDVQKYILSVINKQAHHIAELIRGIRTSGFIDKGDDMIVKRVPGTSKFVVIEGNRRTTAIKYLLDEVSSLKPVVRDTLTNLHVKEFIYKSNRELSEAVVIDILLGTIHIAGRLPWGPLERSYYICNSYLREMKKYTRDSRFEYMPNCSREVATFFNLSIKSVRKEIIIYRVYEQLKEQRYNVTPQHFSLIAMAVTNRKLSEEYFELSPVTFHFSSCGLSRFDKLCLRDKKAINNPRDFRAFDTVFKYGTEYELSLIEANEKPVNEVLDRLNVRREDREFLQKLEKIQENIENLQIAGFHGSETEIQRIKKIKELVDSRLLRLVHKY